MFLPSSVTSETTLSDIFCKTLYQKQFACWNLITSLKD